MMAPAITLQPVSGLTDDSSAERRLVHADNDLVEVLVRCSENVPPISAKLSGTGWRLETGFGACAGVEKISARVAERRAWIAGCSTITPRLVKP
jgi:hypothetical protein